MILLPSLHEKGKVKHRIFQFLCRENTRNKRVAKKKKNGFFLCGYRSFFRLLSMVSTHSRVGLNDTKTKKWCSV